MNKSFITTDIFSYKTGQIKDHVIMIKRHNLYIIGAKKLQPELELTVKQNNNEKIALKTSKGIYLEF